MDGARGAPAARRAGLARALGIRAGSMAIGALALWAAAAAAGELQFSASVDQTTVGLGEQFQLVLTVQGEDMLSVPSPVLPPMPDVSILGSTSSQSTSIVIANGQMKKQATVNFVYALAVQKLGKVVLPPCKLTYQGKEYQSQPIEITVVRAPQGQAAPAPAPPGMPSAPSQAPIEGNLFIAVTPSRRTVYVGEPVQVEIALCTRFQISDGGWAEAPSFDGFWAEKLFDADRLDFQRRTIDGKAFGVASLKKVVLFPLSAGETTIKPMAFNVAVTEPSRDIFDMFGRTQTVRIQSKPVTIKVLALPEKDKPKEFTGGVGHFQLETSLDRASTTNGEPVNLTVKVTGSGNLHMIDPPALPPVPGLKILAPEIKDDVRAAGDGISGSRTFRYPILPQADGKFEIAPVALATFDPGTRAYRTLSGSALEFTASGSATAAPVVESSGLKVLGSDINYIKPDAAALSGASMRPPWWPSLLYLISMVLVGSAFAYRGHLERLQSDRGYARRSRSSALVRRRLRQAEHLLRSHDEKGFHAELARALTGYLGDRFNIDTHALTRDQLRAELARLQVAAETTDEVFAILDRCEVARFSPGAPEARDPRALFESARGIMGRI